MFSSSWLLNRWASTRMHLLVVISAALLLLMLVRVPEASGEESPAQDFGKFFVSCYFYSSIEVEAAAASVDNFRTCFSQV